MTSDQVYIGISLTLVLAVGCQLIGARLRIPALILLLPAGFLAGWLTGDVNPNNLLGASFQPLVSLSVAVILYDAGLGLHLSNLVGHSRRVVIRLLILGIPLTWILAAVVAGPLFGMSKSAAVMFGVILVVSGPTVVGPLLRFVRPTERLRRVLIWEGSLIDPVGALLGAVVFHAVTVNDSGSLADHILQFLLSLVIGIVGGIVGTLVLWLLITKLRIGEVLGTAAQLAVVVAIAGFCDVIREDTGLIAAIGMGLALTNIRAIDMPARRPFFEVLVQLIIGILFVSISATVTPASLEHLLLPTLGLLAVLMLVARPLAAFLSTMRTDLSRGERAFVGWMDPRGIVAAATASTFSAELVAQHIKGADKILPGTFLVIVATVTLYGLSAEPVAKWLGVTMPTITRPLLIGGDPWVVDLGRTLRAAGLPVLMWSDSESQLTQIQTAGLETVPDEALRSATDGVVGAEGVTVILMLTSENGFNALAAALLENNGGRDVYRVGSPRDADGAAVIYAGGTLLFNRGLTREYVEAQFNAGARTSLRDTVPAAHALLFRVRSSGRLAPVTSADAPEPRPGDRLVTLGPLQPDVGTRDV